MRRGLSRGSLMPARVCVTCSIPASRSVFFSQYSGKITVVSAKGRTCVSAPDQVRSASQSRSPTPRMQLQQTRAPRHAQPRIVITAATPSHGTLSTPAPSTLTATVSPCAICMPAIYGGVRSTIRSIPYNLRYVTIRTTPSTNQ